MRDQSAERENGEGEREREREREIKEQKKILRETIREQKRDYETS